MLKGVLDKKFLAIVLILTFGGFFIFSSASLGLLARENIEVSSIAWNQALGLLLGLAVMYIASRVPYSFWNKYSLYLFIGSYILTFLVFIPHIGFTHGGATRWIDLGPISFQPSELLKLSFIIYFSAWLGGLRGKIQEMRYGIIPMAIMLGVVALPLALQPDMDAFVVITIVSLILFIAAGGKWRHAFSFAGMAALIVVTSALFVPYIKARLLTFINPTIDPLGSSYQIQQSLIAIGSGRFFGRGFGQSVQKFNFLPEPVGDSIFAVFAEEWGFVGAVVLLILFLFFAVRGFKIASKAPSMFSGLMVTGIISLIIIQSFINIAAMLGIFPLAGMPLLFVSQGGTALLVTLCAAGIVLGVSRQQKRETVS